MKYAITYKYNNNMDELYMDIISAENASEAIELIEKKHDHEIEWLSLNDADDPYYKTDAPKKETVNGGWQLCPKCNGDGHLIGTTCGVCYGRKIISINNGLPPVYKTKE